MMLGCAMVAMAEGFSLIRKYGVASQTFYDVMTEGLFSAPAYKGYGKTMVDQTFDNVGSPVTVGLKDANLIVAAADIARVPMPSLNIYRDRLLGAMAHGDGDRDQAVLAREQGRACGVDM
jgi:3-hydroxyisobutyrate dehydrogenase-like beta-hydroxyacid dehydrogenase